MRAASLAAPALLLILTAACSAPSHAVATASPPAASAVPRDWPTLTDAAYGYSLRYPSGWVEKFDQPAGFHAFASRAGMTSLLDLQDGDYWLAAQGSERDQSSGCGEPVGEPADRSDTTLGGRTATRYVVEGSRGGVVQHIVLVIGLRGTTCYTLQLVAGGAIPLDRALHTMQTIQDSYRYTR